MQKRLLIAFFALSSLLLFVGLLPVHGEEKVYQNVVRLHVLANSDAPEDQALKLEVRDAVLEVTSPLLLDCPSREEACRRLTEHEEEILAAAREVIAAAGRADPVTMELGEEDYPRRSYDSFCFPAGTYTSLRLCIGEAVGQNWWCCLFPPLCLGSSTVSPQQGEDAFISVGLTPDQYKIITETEQPVYRVRFKLLELLEEWFG